MHLLTMEVPFWRSIKYQFKRRKCDNNFGVFSGLLTLVKNLLIYDDYRYYVVFHKKNSIFITIIFEKIFLFLFVQSFSHLLLKYLKVPLGCRKQRLESLMGFYKKKIGKNTIITIPSIKENSFKKLTNQCIMLSLLQLCQVQILIQH